MKKSVAVLLTAIALCFALFGCEQELSPDDLDNNLSKSFEIYVCGAVAEEGFYSLAEGSAYRNAVEEAGILEQTVMPDFGEQFADGGVSVIIADFAENGKTYNSVNVNSVFVRNKLPIEGVSDDVIALIADYIELNGEIKNKTILLSVLGDKYDSNYYKFYVSETDYEKAN